MRGLGIILSGTLGASVAWAGSAGYLPGVGPGPLRFESPRLVPRVELPPLQMHHDLPLPQDAPSPNEFSQHGGVPEVDVRAPVLQTTEAATSPLAGPATVAIASETANPITSPTNRLDQGLTNSYSPVAYFDPENTEVLSPQMFLRFFSPQETSAGREVVVAVPPGFNPAQPGQPVPSSATYTFSKP